MVTPMELTQKQCKGTQYAERSPILTINNFPDELLVDIFDFCRQDKGDGHCQWLRLIHVCRRWRIVTFASSSRLDLSFVLKPNTGANMEIITSRHFPPLPIDINYNNQGRFGAVEAKDMGRMLAALGHPDRIRRITLTGSTANLKKFFKAAKCPFPALESLKLCHQNNDNLKIPATFLEGSNLHLRSLKVHCISLTTISQFLSSATTLTRLSLGINANVGPLQMISLLLSHLGGMPYLLRLNLEIHSHIDDQAEPTNPNENFTLSKLISFRYRGHSSYLNTLVTGFAAPSLREVDISFFDKTLPPIVHLSRFIEDIRENYYAVQVVLERDYLHLSLLGCSEYIGDRHHRHPPCIRLCLEHFPESIMLMSSVFSAKLTTIQELSIVSLNNAPDNFIPWRKFLLQFPSFKALRMEDINILRIASALYQGHRESNLAFLPALEEIELFMDIYWSRQSALELEVFQLFVSARQKAGFPVRVFCSPRSGLLLKPPL